jgi:signal transduction histidine kinase
VTTCKAHGQAVLTVADTGMGIDAEDLPHIFDRFYRGRNVRQSDIPGTGLGLAIVKEIVDLHEGELEVQSESGKGSTFRVNLPICR